MFKLRPYQQSAVNSIWEYYSEGNTGNPVIAMPTGTGKSLVIGGFLKQVYEHYPNQRIMMLTHVKELIEQNYDKLMKLWATAPAGIYSSGLKRKDIYNSITFGGIGSVVRKADAFGHIDLILIDEAHLVSPNQSTMYQKFITQLTKHNPHLKTIGLTATPYRLGHGHITEEGSLFTDICYDITTMAEFNKLIKEGYICPLIPKKTNMLLNVDGVHKRGGEFIPKELQAAVDRDEITDQAVREAIAYGHDRKCWLVFTAGVEHAIHTAEMLNAYGISAKAVHSGSKKHPMTDAERDQILLDFKAGRFQAVVNNNILTTGFDHPAIDLILMLRPTSSPGLWVQMLGRGTRPLYAIGYDLETLAGRLDAINKGGKQNCLVLDFAGNTQRLGPINDPVLPKRKGKKKQKGDAPVKLCEAVTVDNIICNTWVHASARECPYCGGEFVFETKLTHEASTRELVKDIEEEEIPEIIDFNVEHVTYQLHHKRGGTSSVKVSYFCGIRRFIQFVCIAHEGIPKRRAVKWWKERTDKTVPSSCEELLNKTDYLKEPSSIRVWVNKKYPEILACLYTQTDEIPDIIPESFLHIDKEEAWEDDIPF